MPVRGDIDRDHVVPVIRLVVRKGRWGSQYAGVANQHIEALVALVESQCEPGDAVAILHVERHQGRGATGGLDLVVQLSQPAGSARDSHDMGPGLSKFERDRSANSA